MAGLLDERHGPGLLDLARGPGLLNPRSAVGTGREDPADFYTRLRDFARPFVAGEAPAVTEPTRENVAQWLTDPAVNQYLMEQGLGGMLGGVIKAYHGSPHKFDRFDMGKIGTGEGAQAYGHGLYFAEHPDVAREYQTTLAPYQASREVTRAQRSVWDIESEMADAARRRGPSSDAGDWGDYDMAIPDEIRSEFAPRLDAARRALADAQANEAKAAEGALYEVSLAPDHDDLLDWDAPLSQQSEKVREKLKPLLDIVLKPSRFHQERGITPDPDPTGREIYEAMNDPFLETAKDVPLRERKAARLRAAGIPGLRYLDAGSRGGGEGTRNIVMFDDELIDIVSRNGQPVSRP